MLSFFTISKYLKKKEKKNWLKNTQVIHSQKNGQNKQIRPDLYFIINNNTDIFF